MRSSYLALCIVVAALALSSVCNAEGFQAPRRTLLKKGPILPKPHPVILPHPKVPIVKAPPKVVIEKPVVHPVVVQQPVVVQPQVVVPAPVYVHPQPVAVAPVHVGKGKGKLGK